MAPLEGAVRVTAGQSSFLVRVLRHPKGPGKSIDVVRRPDVLRVYRGPRLPPVVNDMDPLLMFSRSQGRIRKLLRNVSGIPAPFRPAPGTPKVRGYGDRVRSGHDQPAPMY